MKENIAYSMALDLLFNGQNVDYCERPMSLSAVFTMSLFVELPERAHVAVVAPGGGRLVKNLTDRGYMVDAFEGRDECIGHLERMFQNDSNVKILPVRHLDDPTRRDRMNFDALFCMDDLRSFREQQEWTEDVQKMIKPGGYFVYSQVSDRLPAKRNTLDKHFNLVGNYNVSEETAAHIKHSYLGLEDWSPADDQLKTAVKTLGMVETASGLRRSILTKGVEVRYVAWRKKVPQRRTSNED
ncbi:hypothetical protein [Kordiimonas marina]|uniref:hypothetical protein n=1 Tax=Kordiimonas marina TaxID=2872312 RepID=UPI001FF3BF3D|nr:hypothetical protein [Kordiimonas marina]MCJ9429930.1 hypothetical protein [Kordiimonas marina]